MFRKFHTKVRQTFQQKSVEFFFWSENIFHFWGIYFDFFISISCSLSSQILYFILPHTFFSFFHLFPSFLPYFLFFFSSFPFLPSFLPESLLHSSLSFPFSISFPLSASSFSISFLFYNFQYSCSSCFAHVFM